MMSNAQEHEDNRMQRLLNLHHQVKLLTPLPLVHAAVDSGVSTMVPTLQEEREAKELADRKGAGHELERGQFVKGMERQIMNGGGSRIGQFRSRGAGHGDGAFAR